MTSPRCLLRGVFAAAVVFSSAMNAPAATPAGLPRATPESQGLSSTGLLALVDAADASQLGFHSLMIVRHGHVVAEGWWAPYAADEPHMLFSLSKSFTSTAVGMLQAEGRINIHDHLVKYFPEDTPANASENLQRMRLRDLLMMSTGQEKEDVDRINVMAPDGSGTKQFLAAPVKQKPGTLFYYNSPATFMLSATVQKITGQTVRDYLVPRLFEPLGIPTPDWDVSPQGFSQGASGLHLRTEDIAKFGQLLLQRGEWQGRRLLPAEWVDQATARQASNGSDPDGDWDQGYGFQFWRCVPGFYRGDGAMGQFCIVMPQHDTVVAITSGTNDMGAVMKLIWRRLLPELRAASLPEDATATAALRTRLAGLTIRFPEGAATSPLAAKLSGRRFVFDANDANVEWISLRAEAAGAMTVAARYFGAEHQITAGHQQWQRGDFPFAPGSQEPAAAAGAWTAEDTYTLKVAQYRQPYIATFRFKFAGDQLTVEREMNVGPTSGKAVTLTAHAK